MIQRLNIAHDTRVLLERVEHTDAVSVGLWFRHGSRDESPLEKGFSHFLEHMLFKGTSRRGPLQIAQDVDRVGGVLNAFTEKETTCLYATVPREYLELAVDVLLDIAFHSVLPESEIVKEKSIIGNEIEAYEDNPEEMAHEQFLRDMWGEHPLALKISGEIEEINGIERSALLDFYRRYFGVLGCIISVAGGFDIDDVVALLESRLADVPGGQAVPQRVSPVRRASWRHASGPFKQVQLFAGVNFPLPNSTEAFFRLLVFSTVFGESMSSRLFQELRENKGLCYAVYAFRAYYADTALWSVYAGTSPQLVISLLEALNMELRRFKQEPPSEAEITDAKSHLRGGVALSKDDMEARMRRLVRQELLNGVVLDYDEAIRVLEGVTREHVVELIEELVRADSFNLLAYGGKSLGRLEKARFAF